MEVSPLTSWRARKEGDAVTDEAMVNNGFGLPSGVTRTLTAAEEAAAGAVMV